MFTTAVRRMSSRVPMIKFRQGGMPEHGQHAAKAASPANGPGKAGKGAVSAGIVEDWQLPRRYRRRPISDEECNAINLGGAM